MEIDTVDPVAYRLEPLIDASITRKAVPIAYTKGGLTVLFCLVY